jgi:hypothetical protein
VRCITHHFPTPSKQDPSKKFSTHLTKGMPALGLHK